MAAEQVSVLVADGTIRNQELLEGDENLQPKFQLRREDVLTIQISDAIVINTDNNMERDMYTNIPPENPESYWQRSGMMTRMSIFNLPLLEPNTTTVSQAGALDPVSLIMFVNFTGPNGNPPGNNLDLRRVVYQTLENCMMLPGAIGEDEHPRPRSIAFTLIGTGHLGLSEVDSAEQIVGTVASWFEHPGDQGRFRRRQIQTVYFLSGENPQGRGKIEAAWKRAWLRYIRAPIPAPFLDAQVTNLQDMNATINGVGTSLGATELPVEPLITYANVIAGRGLGPPRLLDGHVASPAAVIRANNRMLRNRNIPNTLNM
ncbi:hypothetical protein BGZ60DRAFT_535090 [Tricladium varicosporioides]|nr:hypothetical protein BGZ60DRAFT_535090 [Hymenoscyphus varicosporioides]